MNSKVIALLIACAMAVAGCSAPPPPESSLAPQSPNSGVTPPQSPNGNGAPPQEVDRNTIYTVEIDNGVSIAFDADGNVVEQPQEDSWVTLTDVLTGEAQYKMHTKTEDTGEDDKWGNPVTHTTAALHTLDGELLYDYDDYTYGDGVGGLIVRKQQLDWLGPLDEGIPKDYKSALWNPTTGKSVQPKVAELKVLDKDKGILAVIDAFGNLMGTVDTSGSMVRSIDNAYQVQVQGNRLVVCSTSWDDYTATGRYTLLDEELAPLTTVEYISGNGHGVDKNMFMYRDKGEMGMMDSSGTKLFAMSQGKGQYVDFCDGELAIMSLANGRRLLMKLDGTELGEQYDHVLPICPDKHNLTEPPAQFVVSRGETVSIVDRQGAVVRSAVIDGLGGINETTAEHIIYGTAAIGSANPGKDGLMDLELNVVLEAGKYNDLSPYRDYSGNNPSGEATGLVVGQYYPRTNPKSGSIDYSMVHYDLYDSELNLIADSLTNIGTVGKGRVAVVRGFAAGVLDWQGNWIGKTSIFQIVSDERKVNYF